MKAKGQHMWDVMLNGRQIHKGSNPNPAQSSNLNSPFQKMSNPNLKSADLKIFKSIPNSNPVGFGNWFNLDLNPKLDLDLPTIGNDDKCG